MNSKIIQQYGEEILCYRLRTARQKKRMLYEDFDKQLIELYREEKALNEQKNNLGWEPLHPPVQKGWKRFFVLRDDVARSKHAEFFEGILEKINTYDWSHRKDFKIKRRKRGRKIYVVKPQKLLEPAEWHFPRLGFNEYEQQFFHVVWSSYRNKVFVKKYVFNEPWRFVLRVRPNMITKMKKRDEIIASRVNRIAVYMERNDYRKRQAKLLHGSYKWTRWRDFGKYDEANPLRNKSLQQILDELKDL